MEQDIAFSGYVNLRLGAEQKKALERLAAKDHRSLSAYIRVILTEHLERTAGRRKAE
jgi:hypothetical protein